MNFSPSSGEGINDSMDYGKHEQVELTKDSDIEQEFTDAEEFYNLSHSSQKQHTIEKLAVVIMTRLTISQMLHIVNPDAGE